MRGSVAKALRRQARAATEGGLERQYLRFKDTNVIVVDRQTTRGIYKQLKKQYKAGGNLGN